MSVLREMPPIERWPAATIEPFSDGTWQPTPEQPDPDHYMPECMLYQIEEVDGSLYDVIAWESARPHIWWLRYGRATFLGEWSANHANRMGWPVWLCSTPAEYLRHSPAAMCILRWDESVDLRAILGLANELICTEPLLWERVQAVLRERQPVNLRLVA